PPKFDASGEKFRMWSRSFLGFARQHGFVEAFDLDVPIQRIRYDESVQEMFSPHELDVAQRGWNALVGAVTDTSLTDRIWSCDSPRSAWNMLEERFDPISSVSLENCQLEFQTTCLTPGANPVLFLDDLFVLAQKMESMGDPRSEHMVCLRFLGGLTDEYESIRTNLMTSEDELTASRVRTAVSRKYQMTLQDRKVTALVSKGQGVVGRKLQGSKKGNGNDRSKKRRCFRCGAIGHFIKDCKAQVIPAPSQAEKSSGAGESPVFALIGCRSVDLKSSTFEKWIGDAGASNHMTSSTAFMYDLKPCNVSVSGIGGRICTA
ncbi:unnamed protein product, partial [Discosporangium mesarthrocarpum]